MAAAAKKRRRGKPSAQARRQQKALEDFTAAQADAYQADAEQIDAIAAQAIRDATVDGADGARWRPGAWRSLEKKWGAIALLILALLHRRLRSAGARARARAAQDIAGTVGGPVLLPEADTKALDDAAADYVATVQEAIKALRGDVIDGVPVRDTLTDMRGKEPGDHVDVVYEVAAGLAMTRQWKARRTIRTELVKAYGQAALESLVAADARLPVRTWKRIWVSCTRADVCWQCSEMGGQIVGLNEPFITPLGDEIMSGGAHPGCHCIADPYIGRESDSDSLSVMRIGR